MQNEEVAIKWLDWLAMSKEAAMLVALGIEGEHYYKDNTGAVIRMDSPDPELNMSQYLMTMGSWPALPWAYELEVFRPGHRDLSKPGGTLQEDL